ncbi:MAG TPA: IclR family transcriptional regulator [Polyangiaceae bacterium]
MQSVQRAIDLLMYVGECGRAVGVTEVALRLGLPKTTAHRLLKTLTYRHLLEHAEDGRYRPGLGMLLLSPPALGASALTRAADPLLSALAAALGETFFLVVRRGDQVIVVHKVEGSGFLRASPNVGSAVPVHATAAGRVFLAFSTDLGLPAPLTAYTRRTPQTAARLQRLVDQTRHERWAVSVDEWHEGLAAIAAPVFCGERLVAAVAVACSSARLRQLGERQLIQATQNLSKALSRAISGVDKP